jgi:hypothetical protein
MSEFRGCTVVLIIGTQRVSIMHARQIGLSGCLLDTAADVEKDIIPILDDADFFATHTECDSWVYILGSSTKTAGFERIEDELVDAEGLQRDRLRRETYSGGSEGGDVLVGPEGKVLIEWDSPDTNGGTLRVYDRHGTPFWTFVLDSE